MNKHTRDAAALGEGRLGQRSPRRSEEIYAKLRGDIGKLELAPGTGLREEDLSARYQASRTPVREALFRLQQEGFLEKRGRKLFVREFTPQAVRELYNVREGLEKMAVRLCIERATEHELDELETQLRSYKQFDFATDYAAFSDLANQFHRSVAWLSGNCMLHERLLEIHDQTVVISSRWLLQKDSIDEAFREHGLILGAIRRRDVTVAEALTRAHIQRAVTVYEKSGGSESTASVGKVLART